MNQSIYQVSQLTREIKEVIESSFPRLWVTGELSNVKHHSSGHLYFTLKDENAQISCAMWRSRTGHLLFRPLHGMKVIVEGNLQVYAKGGNYQLIIQQMQPAGMGSLQMAFEQLKRKLQAEGLFDPEHKKPLPGYPTQIGIITSPTGAALRDIISVIRRRLPCAKMILYPVNVQGKDAAEAIAAAINDFNQYGSAEVLIVGRGGGSLEDLWAFNEAAVARAIFASRIPVISAVGHETDFSIADFTADYRAATPSAAAEIAARSSSEIQGQLNYYQEKFTTCLSNRLKHYRERLEKYQKSYAFRLPVDMVYQKMQRLDELQRHLNTTMSHRLRFKKQQLEHLKQQLQSMNPERLLQRGYSIAYKGDDIIKSITQLTPNDLVKIRLANGTFTAAVQKTGEE